MEVVIVLSSHPVGPNVEVFENGEINSEDVDFIDIGVEENVIINFGDNVLSKYTNPNKINPDLSDRIIVKKDSFLDLSKIVNGEPNFPGIELNMEKLDVVKFTSDLLLNINLDLTFKNVLQITEVKKFDQTLSYDQDSKNLAKKLIVSRGAFFDYDQNYFDVPNKYITKNTKVRTLRNSRVVLFWRNVELSEYQKKRILTLGLSHLLNVISYAELYYCIQKALPRGQYLITIRPVPNSYVLIGVEREVFSF